MKDKEKQPARTDPRGGADALSDQAVLEEGRRVLSMEARALEEMGARLNHDFCRAVRAVAACQGKVVLTGVGKSGFVARKIASTLSSLGRPSFFVHPTEGVHGDLGMLRSDDLLISVSQSGSTNELVSFLTVAKTRFNVPVIAIVGENGGNLERWADIVLATGAVEEACALGLAPTTSSTAALALGDALAVAVSRLMGLEAKDFAALHPAGALGHRLYAPVEKLMRREFPRVDAGRTLREISPLITQGGIGLAVVEDKETGRLGVVTDGDIRRAVQKGPAGLDQKARDVMSASPKSVGLKTLGMDALMEMERSRITSLVVLDEQGRLAGVLHIHDILRYGLDLVSPAYRKGNLRDVLP